MSRGDGVTGEGTSVPCCCRMMPLPNAFGTFVSSEQAGAPFDTAPYERPGLRSLRSAACSLPSRMVLRPLKKFGRDYMYYCLVRRTLVCDPESPVGLG